MSNTEAEPTGCEYASTSPNYILEGLKLPIALRFHRVWEKWKAAFQMYFKVLSQDFLEEADRNNDPF